MRNKFKISTYLSQNNKNIKVQISKATSSARRVFASQDIHNDNSLNTDVEKENETEINTLQTKFADSMIFEIHSNHSQLQ